MSLGGGYASFAFKTCPTGKPMSAPTLLPCQVEIVPAVFVKKCPHCPHSEDRFIRVIATGPGECNSTNEDRGDVYPVEELDCPHCGVEPADSDVLWAWAFICDECGEHNYVATDIGWLDPLPNDELPQLPEGTHKHCRHCGHKHTLTQWKPW